MTRRDNIIKWFFYALGVLPIWLLETAVFNRLPVLGVIPMLLPLTVVATALWEGTWSGGVFGLCVGILADAVYPGIPGGMTIGLAIIGVLTGAVAQYSMRESFPGYFICSAVALVCIDLVRVLSGLLTGLASFGAMMAVALPEILWSLVFTVPIYLLFQLIYRRVGGTHLM